MKFFLILACTSMFSFALVASEKLTAAKSLVNGVITNSITIANYNTLDMIELSLDTVEIDSLECGDDSNKLNSICVVTATEKTETKHNVRGFYFIVDSDLNLITRTGVIPVKKINLNGVSQ